MCGSDLSRLFKRFSGFTLMEVMIVIAIVGMLAAIAYPSYEQYLIKSRRAEAKQFLLDVAQREEEYFLNVNSYLAVDGCAGAGNWAALGLVAPQESVGHYCYAVSANGGCNNRYLVTATAQNRQAKDGNLTLDACSAKTGKW